VDCSLFQMGCFIVARFLLTSTSHSSSAIAGLIAQNDVNTKTDLQGHIS